VSEVRREEAFTPLGCWAK